MMRGEEKHHTDFCLRGIYLGIPVLQSLVPPPLSTEGILRVTPFSLNLSFGCLFLYQRQCLWARKAYFEVHVYMCVLSISKNNNNICAHKIWLQKRLIKQSLAWWWFTLAIWSTNSIEWIGCCRSFFPLFSFSSNSRSILGSWLLLLQCSFKSSGMGGTNLVWQSFTLAIL